MKRHSIHDLSISQSILAATLIIVVGVLLFTSIVYYTSFSRRTDALVESQSREINKQIVLNYKSYISSVLETANYILSGSINLDARDSIDSLQRLYSSSMEIKKDVASIFLFDSQGNLVLGSFPIPNAWANFSGENWFINARNERTIFHFSPPHDMGIFSTEGEEVISVSRLIEYSDGGVRKEGVLLIELNFNTLAELAAQTNLGKGGHILIIDDNDSLLYSFGGDSFKAMEESYRLSVENLMGGFKALIDSREMYININTLAQTRWRIVTVYNINAIAEAKDRMILIIFMMFLVSFFVTAVIAYWISYRITRPLYQLEKTMERIEKGDFHSKVEVSGQKEIVLLAGSFNSMIDEIRTLMIKVVDEQREKRKTELKALQNQINPHFLYNTLDSIVWLAENQRSQDVINTVVALARFFRISISKGKNFISVRSEIEHIKNYLTIQSIRYVDKFTYSFEVDEDILEKKVMKLILQPIVENAIYHGVGEEDGYISISGRQEGNFLYFSVTNSGYGLTDERIEEIHRVLEGGEGDTGVGLKNVYLRLKIYYGDKADILFSSELDEWTRVTIKIPLATSGGSGS